MRYTFDDLDWIERDIYELERALAHATSKTEERKITNRIVELEGYIEDIYRDN
jgi:hypothetical protein